MARWPFPLPMHQNVIWNLLTADLKMIWVTDWSDKGGPQIVFQQIDRWGLQERLKGSWASPQALNKKGEAESGYNFKIVLGLNFIRLATFVTFYASCSLTHGQLCGLGNIHIWLRVEFFGSPYIREFKLNWNTDVLSGIELMTFLHTMQVHDCLHCHCHHLFHDN